MFEISTQFERCDLDPMVELKGYANNRTVNLASITFPPGTLRFDEFIGGVQGGRFVGHLRFTHLDEPCPDDQRMNFDKLIEIGGGQASELQPIPTTDVVENLEADTVAEAEHGG